MRFWTIPNAVTLLRLLAFPLLWALAFLRLTVPFGVVYAVAVATDALEGYLARKLKQTSEFGAWFDNLADNLIGFSLPVWL